MMIQSFTSDEREPLLRKRLHALIRYNAAMDEAAVYPPWSEAESRARAEAEASLQTAEAAEGTYAQRLPRLVMSCCPFDGKPLVRTFDPYGLDGLWWKPDATLKELPACPHFCVLRGAVHYNGFSPQAGPFEVHPGPEVPYVIPRLLAYPGVVAVISQINMKNGYIAYPIAYFAERRPPPQDLTADWPRTLHAYTTQLGESAWKIPNDPWDFDLQPWIEKGKIRWCPPGSDHTFLSDAPPERCPYVDLPGLRERVIVEGEASWTRGLPTGEPAWPLNSFTDRL